MSDTLEDKIRNSRNVKDASIRTYMSAINSVRRDLGINSNTLLTDTDFLDDFDAVIDSMKGGKITSRKNKLTGILVALSTDDSKKEDLIDKYATELRSLNDQYMHRLKEQRKTPEQKANWLNYSGLVAIANRLKDAVVEAKILGADSLSRRQFDILQQYLIIRTYLSFPLRNDFADMKVLTEDEFDELSEKERDSANFLVLHPADKKFHINQFKNRKFIGAKILTVPDGLSRLIDLWLKYNNTGWYLVRLDRKAPMSPNNITKFLNKIFIRMAGGKKISSSMIRHIVITHSLRNEPTIKEKEQRESEIEDMFMHSQKLNDLYRKVD